MTNARKATGDSCRGRIGGAGVFLAALVATLGSGACTVGDGVGQATGPLFVERCFEGGGDFGTRQQPALYDLKPDYFVGEPIDDIQKNGDENRLVIRLQTEGKKVEADNLLVFDLTHLYSVAQCVRGPVQGENGLVMPFNPEDCYWAPGASWPRIRIGPRRLIRADLAPRIDCPNAYPFDGPSGPVATAVDVASNLAAVPVPPDDWPSWIELSALGSAGRPAVDPQDREPVAPTFKVGFGQTLRAEAFHLELMDDRVVQAELQGMRVPRAEIFGSLDGFFEFRLERGQGAQTFP